MREILFRGKPKSNNEYYCFSQVWRNNCRDGFVYGSLIIQADRYFICVSTVGVKMNCCINNSTVSMIEVIPKTVGQYTGLTDKNGKKIFEGDIVKTDKFSEPNKQYIIKYDLQFGAFIGCDRYNLYFVTFDGDSDEFEVIGNIHDNPELLKEAKQYFYQKKKQS